jgi:glycosyltransferase involved in cell wall biosynthesis
MPVHNGERYLAESIESILSQTCRNFEFIIIDDGSTDATSQIIRQYVDDRIVVIWNRQRLGLSQCLNIGIERSHGEYVARMDGDDISLPERFDRQIQFLRSHPEVQVLGTAISFIDEYGNQIAPKTYPAQHIGIEWCLNFCSPLAHPTVMMTRRLLESCGGYASKYAEDYDLWLRASKLTTFANLPDALLLYRKHSSNYGAVYRLEQGRQTILLRQQIMSTVLNEAVPAELVQMMENNDYSSTRDFVKAADLIYRLFRAYCRNHRLSHSDRRYVSRDVALRLFVLVRPNIISPRLWKYLLLSCLLRPGLLLRIINMPFRRVGALLNSSLGLERRGDALS